ncbi:MAG: dihydrolipoyl dehydrogenase family protein [Candidatus Kariarchaeaceae archaeon]|jgi:pyruvate/2-oxoglutarate dehydrogenase complex dihydrolipoamide dehydrogenase (E3) component
MEYDYDLISIGSGSAGRRVAVALKRTGWKIAIIEKDVDQHFGGTCICSGCIPTKALIEKSSITKDFTSLNEHKEKIVERIRSGTLRHVEKRMDVDVISGFATFVDEHTIRVGEKSYSSEIIVIATGSKTFIPAIKGIQEVNYVTSKEFLHNTKVPHRLLIIGAGRIGLEFGQLYQNLGSKVQVFEGFPNIFANAEDHEMSNMIEEHLKSKGLSILKGKFVDEVREEKLNDTSSEFTVVLNDGEFAGEYKGDIMLVATGRIPNITNLGLENTSIELEGGTIKVNEFMQTSVSHIFAIGDVTGNPMFTNWASYQSGHILKNLKRSKTNSKEWEVLPKKNLPRIAFTQPEFAATGLTEEQARAKYGDDVVVYKFQNKWLGKSMILGDWDGVLKGIGLKGSNEIIGAHLWGERTGSLIQMIVMAMDNGLGWNELSSMVYGHPVLSEGIYGLAAGMRSKVGI